MFCDWRHRTALERSDAHHRDSVQIGNLTNIIFMLSLLCWTCMSALLSNPAGLKPGSGGSPLPFLLYLRDLRAECQGLRPIPFAQQPSKVMHAVSHLELEDEDSLISCHRDPAAF